MTADEVLNGMEDAARAAGALLSRHASRLGSLTVEAKSPGDFVSQADREAEALLRDRLSALLPDVAWLGEETVTGERTVPQKGWCWVVDPLDGTTNFLRGMPHWAVSVGLARDGVVEAGVILDAPKGEMFRARRGGGAFLNGARLRVASPSGLDRAVFATGLPFGAMDWITTSTADLSRLLPRCAGVRRWGAAALDLAWVAAGRVDGFWEHRLQPWDIAAGLVVAAEAGAVVVAVDPEADLLNEGSVIAAAPAVADAFAAIIRGGA